MSVTIILDLKKAVAMQKVGRTISDLAEFGHYYRHPDTATIAYPEAVSKAIGTLPANTNLKIAIVGGGAAGIAATYELSQIGSGMSNGSIDVTIFEADPENFLFTGAKPRELTNRRAGRVSATRAEGKTVYEIGAMRFPEIAGLTWHYAERVFGGDASVETFPNPGTVPTEFIFGSRIDRYIGDTWHDMDSPTRKIRGVIADGLAGSQSTPSLYQIGNKNPSTVSQQLSDSQTSEEVLAQIHLDWKQFIAAYDGTTLEAAVRHIIITRQADLPPIPALTADERINYYVELFGRFGFGTGGFKSLFNISLVEMMRLILWNYSNEYTLPVKENVEFIEGIYSKAKAAPRFSISAKQQRVSDVYHQEPGVIEPRQAVVAS